LAKQELEAVWYGFPIREYNHPDDGKFRQYHMKAFKEEGASLGFLPLPHQYAEAWVQLWYSVIYWMLTWKACVGELGRCIVFTSSHQSSLEACLYSLSNPKLGLL
jgi:hypothetical protein